MSIDCICLHRLTGNRKADIAKFGVADMTDWIIVAFPAVERKNPSYFLKACVLEKC